MELVLKTTMRGAHGQPKGCYVGITGEGLVVFEDVYRGISGVITLPDSREPVKLSGQSAEGAVSAVYDGYIRGYDYVHPGYFRVPNALMSELTA